MIDRSLLIRQSLLPLLAEQELEDVIVATSYQPAEAGRSNGATLYFFQIPTGGRYGWQARKEKWNDLTDTMDREELQPMREGFQMQALNDSGVGIAAADLAVMAAMLVGCASFREALAAEGVGIERITAIRSPYVRNEFDQNELAPSFDFTLTHTARILQISRAIDRAEINFIRV